MSVEPGDEVRLEYVGRFDEGSVFATSDYEIAEDAGLVEAMDADRTSFTPLSFTVGDGDVIHGLDQAVVGMSAGEEASVTVPPENGYGAYDPDRVREYDPETFEGMVGRPPETGLHVEAYGGLHGDVTAVSPDSVEVDFNHELAGRTLVFEVEVLSVE